MNAVVAVGRVYCRNLRAGFPEAKVKTMFSSLAQVRKRSQKKAGAAGVAAAGDNRVVAVGEEISDDVTATPQLACSGPFHLSLVMYCRRKKVGSLAVAQVHCNTPFSGLTPAVLLYAVQQ